MTTDRIRIVSVDIETSGFHPRQNNVLEVAAIVGSLDKADAANLRFAHFHCFLQHEQVVWDPSTLDFHRRNGWFEYRDEMIKHNNVPMLNDDAFITKFGMFLAEYDCWDQSNSDPKLRYSATAVGKNFGSFDLQFLENIYGFRKCKFFRHRAIDLGNLLWLPKVDGNVLPSSEVCAKLIDSSGQVKHRAMDDAMLMLYLLDKWMEVSEKIQLPRALLTTGQA